MSPKFLIFPLFLAAIAFNHLSTISSAETKPVIHIISSPRTNMTNINIQIKSGGTIAGRVAALNPGQEYEVQANLTENVYYAMAISGMKFTSFYAYEPQRDTGRANIYWKIDNRGFHISYDRNTWKQLAFWLSE